MLLSAKVEPIVAFPIGERAMTKNAATAASTADKTSARTRTHVVRTPPRLAERSSNPTVRSSRPEPEAWSHRSARPAPTTTTMKAIGIGPTVAVSTEISPSLMTPCAVGRIVSEIPSRMLSVARVAMIDGILRPRIRAALTSPSATAHSRMTPIPRRICAVDASAPIRNEAMTTPRPIMPPTERSRYPTRIACVCAIAATIRGNARIRICSML